LSTLFLGPQVDPNTLEPTSEDLPIKLESLARHAVVFGATGSGKTGLSVVLLEELVAQGVPVIAVDPKGDLANLAFLFREHTPEQFAPWVDPVEASSAGIDVATLAAQTAEKWRRGLQRQGIGPERLAAVADKLDLQILTPGSRSGTPVDVLGALADPAVDADDADGLDQAVGDAVRMLLELVGVVAEPMRDPRHVLLSHILQHAWSRGERPKLDDLVVRLVDPPFAKVGAFPIDTFLSRPKRMDLAVALNGLLASPSFSAWSDGVSLDIDTLLEADPGKVPVRVIYLAHLDENERQFAAGLLLSRLASWSRRQSGTQRLRALLLFDEAWGYVPPHPRNPPTKRPLLQLMKQARAVGLGVVLATQNPVDIDYKVLSNAGTWLVGRLATPQDRDRVLDGAAPEVRGWLDKLPKRTFWIRRPGSAPDALLSSRWAMTWLRGPVTLRELERITPEAPVPEPAPVLATPDALAGTTERPEVPGMVSRFLDPEVARSARIDGLLGSRAAPHRPQQHWEPALLARLRVRFDERSWDSERDELRLVFPLDGGRVRQPELRDTDLFERAPTESTWAPLPADLSESWLTKLGRTVIADVHAGETAMMYRHRSVGVISKAGEDRAAFRLRVEATLIEEAEADNIKLREKVERTVDRLEDKRDKLERDLARARQDARGKMATEVVNVGETLLGMLFGGRRRSLTTIATRRQSTSRASSRVDDLESRIRDLQNDVFEAESELELEMQAIRNKHLRTLDDIEEREVGLEKDDIELVRWDLVWVPVTAPV